MKNIVSVAGWLLCIAGIAFPIIAILTQFPGGESFTDKIYDIFTEGVLPGVIVFLITFFSGKYFIGVGKGKINLTKLNKTAAVFTLVALAVILTVFFFSISVSSEGGFLFLVYTIFVAAPLYATSLTLLMVDFFKNRKAAQ